MAMTATTKDGDKATITFSTGSLTAIIGTILALAGAIIANERQIASKASPADVRVIVGGEMKSYDAEIRSINGKLDDHGHALERIDGKLDRMQDER